MLDRRTDSSDADCRCYCLPRMTAAHAYKVWDRFTLFLRILISLALVVHPFSSKSHAVFELVFYSVLFDIAQ